MATFHPTSPNSSAKATSLTIGAEMRNEKVTPKGTPAERRPMNTGTAEQEQNGVTTRSSVAGTFPIPSRRPASRARVRSVEKKQRTIPMRKADQRQQQKHHRYALQEDGDGLSRMAAPFHRKQ